MTEIKWQEPPADARGKNGLDSDGILAALKSRPGQWALVAERAHSTAGDKLRRRGAEIKRHKTDAFTPSGKTPLYDIYARFPMGGDQ